MVTSHCVCVCVLIHSQIKKVKRTKNPKNKQFMASNSIFESLSSYQSVFIRGKCSFLFACCLAALLGVWFVPVKYFKHIL